MRNETAHVVNERKKVGLSPLLSHHDQRAMQGVALPQIVWELGFKFPAIDGRGGPRLEESFAFEKAVEGAFASQAL